MMARRDHQTTNSVLAVSFAACVFLGYLLAVTLVFIFTGELVFWHGLP